jgi:hypothetical protein
MTTKRNCWEVLGCGLEPGGKHVGAKGPCAAAIEVRADGMHDGVNGGRVCWSIIGTQCYGGHQTTFAAKMNVCLKCAFYRQVQAEEGDGLLPPADVIKTLMEPPAAT